MTHMRVSHVVSPTFILRKISGVIGTDDNVTGMVRRGVAWCSVV